MRAQLERVLAQARERAPEAVAPIDGVIEDLWTIIAELQGMPLSEIGHMTRIHGDLHLGQTLLHPDEGWKLLDFEGEPAKSIDQRRALSSPLRDVAGMIRSFDYAAAAGALAVGRTPSDLPAPLANWREEARTSFLDGYTKSAPDSLAGIASGSIVVTAFELDKAIYELGYELANRPSWVPIPVSGIVRAVHRYRKATL
jgi:trehalose synthase-fused probable maltokinase